MKEEKENVKAQTEKETSKVEKQHEKENKKEVKVNIDELNQLREKCNHITELENAILRSNAELINYRKRKDEEVGRQLKYCNEDLVKELLPIVDNFERAIKLDDDNLDDSLSKFLDGFKMIYGNIQNVLTNYGVKAIDGTNKPFDPTYHQAVLMEQRDDVEHGTVLEVLQKGYLLKDKVIRPAMVRVSE